MKIKFIIMLPLFCLAFFSQTVFCLAAPAANGFLFTYKNLTFPIDQATVNSWKGLSLKTTSNLLKPPSTNLTAVLLEYFGQETQNFPDLKAYGHRPEKIYASLNDLSQKINLPPVEPELLIKDNKAIKFTPPQTGLSLDVFQSTFNTLEALESGQNTVEMAVEEILPKTSLSNTNSLGINELVAEGKSNFKGSPKNRRHNISVGVEKFKGVIVGPGAEFSFNKNLGPVEAAEGFLPELVIKKEGTIPELGGGLCQVSSTTFRAAVNGGFPITQRRNHAYAVQYYSPQGTDATIYPGVIDLKFINDTTGSLLIWPYFTDKDNLVFDFYGSKDDRQVTVDKPTVYDRKPDGSMKATWTRTVVKDGQSRNDVFKSVYQSPELFHKEETFVTASTSQPNITKIQ